MPGIDEQVERVRERGGVRQKALVIANAVHESDVREVLGIDVQRRYLSDHSIRRVLSPPGGSEQARSNNNIKEEVATLNPA